MAKPKEAPKEEANKEENAVAVQEVPKGSSDVSISDSTLDLIEEDDGAGQNFTVDDLTIPRLGIIQSLSPQRSKSKDQYIEGAEEGMIFDNVNKALKDGSEGVLAVPVLYRRTLLEWFPRESGKGLAANHGDDFSLFEQAGGNVPDGETYDPAKHGEVDDKGRRYSKDGNLLSPTAEYYLFIVDKSGQAKRFVLSMDGTALRQAKQWNSQINQAFATNKDGSLVVSKKTGNPIQAPIFYYVYRMRTVPVSNQQGEWFRWEINNEQIEFGDEGEKRAMSVFDFPNGEQIYKDARLFREAVDKDEIKTEAYDTSHQADVEETDADPM